MKRRDALALAATLAAAGLAGRTGAQAGPTRIVFPFAPGGGGDALARQLASELRAILGETVIVENPTGAGGRIGVRLVKAAAADGRTLLMTPIAPIALYPSFYPALDYDPFKDFAPIAQIATFDFGIAVGPRVPVATLPELVAHLKANRGDATFGSPGAGTIPHFFGRLVGARIGVELEHLPYRGSAEALKDLIGGHLPIVVTTTSDLAQQHNAGRVRILATSGKAPSPFLKDVPTLVSSGFAIDGEGWYGIFTPAGVPADRRAALAAAVAQAVRRESMKQFFDRQGLVGTGLEATAFAELVRRDFEFWAEPIKASGFRPAD